MSKYIHPYSLALVGRNGSDRLAYRDYLQQQSFVSEVTDSVCEVRYAISRNARDVIATTDELHERGFEISESIGEGIGELNETMVEGFTNVRDGFDMVSVRLEKLDQGIQELGAKFDWGFSQMISAIGSVDESLEDLVAIARTPAQTWAYNQFEIAREAIGRGLYREAVESLDRAIHGFGGQTGYKLEYRFHYQLGILNLGDYRDSDLSLVDLNKAETAFANAGRYATAENPIEASTAYIAAGWAAYCRGAAVEAESHTQKAVKIYADNWAAFYQLAKIQMYSGKVQEACANLRAAIKHEREYAVKATTDLDMLNHTAEVMALLEELRRDARSSATEQMEEVNSWWNDRDKRMDEWFSDKMSQISKELTQVKERWGKNTYFGFLDAKEHAQKAKQLQGDIQSRFEKQRDERDNDAWNWTKTKLEHLRQDVFHNKIHWAWDAEPSDHYGGPDFEIALQLLNKAEMEFSQTSRTEQAYSKIKQTLYWVNTHLEAASKFQERISGEKFRIRNLSILGWIMEIFKS